MAGRWSGDFVAGEHKVAGRMAEYPLKVLENNYFVYFLHWYSFAFKTNFSDQLSSIFLAVVQKCTSVAV